ncbi:hypothetical protein J3Q64DRAFT_1625130, partial [Phycomyces blakesleeanus]
YIRRDRIINLSSEAALVHANNLYKHDLIKVNVFGSRSLVGSPKRKMSPVSVFLSPSNR